RKDVELILPIKDFLWLGAGYDVISEYVSKPEYRKLMFELHSSGLSGNSLSYEADLNFWRKRDLKTYYDRYQERFKNFFVDKSQL
ncbi:hypothetical protein, partial [Bacillus licheniformis]|uniref:hypothetical protein n=1 Tax=Bacillus licheniformis TaxID=1402 RepID=UPI001C89FB6B